jgi:hypothetical protein
MVEKAPRRSGIVLVIFDCVPEFPPSGGLTQKVQDQMLEHRLRFSHGMNETVPEGVVKECMFLYQYP